MPIYNFKCNDCNQYFDRVLKVGQKPTECELCHSPNIIRVVDNFGSLTETSPEAKFRRAEEQHIKDQKRWEKDDKFVANITGADDCKSAGRSEKVYEDAMAKNEEARKSLGKRLKRVDK